MFYCEIDENKKCFHVTESKLPLSDTIILSDENRMGKIYQNGEWVEPPEPVEEEPVEGETE